MLHCFSDSISPGPVVDLFTYDDAGLNYDVEIRFSRRHPFEPPTVSFPHTVLNRMNPQHPNVDMSGVLRTEFLSFQGWLPTCGALDVFAHIRELFTSHPLLGGSGDQPALLKLSHEGLHRVLQFLDVAGEMTRRCICIRPIPPLLTLDINLSVLSYC